jgi:hypothetical protein
MSKSFYERGIFYNSNGSRNANSVKLILGLFNNIPYLGVPLGPLKVNESCHSPHLAKIQGMNSISKPRLRIEIYTFQEIMSTEEFRKNSLPALVMPIKPNLFPRTPS